MRVLLSGLGSSENVGSGGKATSCLQDPVWLLTASYLLLPSLLLARRWGEWKCEVGQVRVGQQEKLMTDSDL